MLVLLILVGAVACNDDNSGHQFAGDVPTAPLPTMVPTPTPTYLQPAQAAASPVSVAQLLKPNGGPSRIFFLAGTALWAANANASGAHQIFDPASGRVRAVAVTKDGSRVAVLVAFGAGGKDWSIHILDGNGHEQGKIGQVVAVFGDATLQPTATASLAWSPKGDQLLLAVTGGGIAAIPLRGKPQLLVTARQAAAPGAAVWSPRGNAIAFLDPVTGSAPAQIYVAQTSAIPLDPASIVAPRSPRTIVAFAWAAGGNDVLYIQTNGGSRQSQRGGNIFSITAAGEHARLLISGGTAGPAAEIVQMALSPDGTLIAYTVFQPNGNGMAFLSLWVQQLQSPDRVLLPVPGGQAVTDLWWTNAGLVWRTVPAGSSAPVSYAGGPFSLYRADMDGNAIRLLSVTKTELAKPAASPVASPGGAPGASPVASPRAAPATSPVSRAATPTP